MEFLYLRELIEWVLAGETPEGDCREIYRCSEIADMPHGMAPCHGCPIRTRLQHALERLNQPIVSDFTE